MENSIENNRNLVTPEFMRDQLRLPRDQWDPEFCAYIDKKIKKIQEDKQKHDEYEILPRAEREATFVHYLEHLGLDEANLRNKRILDLGTGPEGEFVKYCLDKGITKDAYGIDTRMNESDIEEAYQGHLIKGDFTKGLPVKNMDLILAHGVLDLIRDEQLGGIISREGALKALTNTLNSLNENGEIRIATITESSPPLAGILENSHNLDIVLKEIAFKNNIEYYIEPRDIQVSDSQDEFILDSTLIIRKKPSPIK